ncbi:unnamed protein product [Clonostachys rhizophaga]|uniref:Uncharacterized protein n=1 Tax=Clonostachys rhizophaga TaxID=160324 RepID=A0A9N9VTU6_9HYPO|nr:unnamed protein product [Clonostachys rhizophaga]
MSKSAPSDKDAGFKRANEISSSMLGMPGYADDSMLFVVRFANKLKTRLSQRDHDQFWKSLDAMTKASARPAEEFGGVEGRAQHVSELRQATLESVKDYPDLVQEFDHFCSVSRAQFKKYRGEAPSASSSSTPATSETS